MALKRRALLLAIPFILVPTLLLAAGIFFLVRWLHAPPKPLPTIIVEASYPGANAQVVADTVAAPIEEQVNGVEGMYSMTSESTDRGTYRLIVSFQRGTDLNIAQVLVQNRVALAAPQLPEATNIKGVVVKKMSRNVLLLISLSSPDRSLSELNDYATGPLKGELARLAGIGDVTVIGPRGGGSQAFLNGKPVVIVCVNPMPNAGPQEVSAAVQSKLAALAPHHLEGMRVSLDFDFAPNWEAPDRPKTEYLLLDHDVPRGASAERHRRMLNDTADMVRDVAGVQEVLALSEHPFDLTPLRSCILVRLAPAAGRKEDRQQIVRAIRRVLESQEAAVVRLRDLSGASRFPRCGYPIDFAVYDRGAKGLESQWELAERIVARLNQSPQLTDVLANQEAMPFPRLDWSVDVAKARDAGVAVADINAAIKEHVALDSLTLADDLKRVKVANSKGEEVPLSQFVTVRETSGPAAVYRGNLYRMVEITANLAADVSPGEARKLVENAVQQELSATDGMMWLEDVR
jgi:multidrug efflux pump subunit AcrB